MSSKLITRKYMKDLIKRDKDMNTSEKAFVEIDRVAHAILAQAICLASNDGRKTVMDRDIIFATKDFAQTMLGGNAES